MTTSNTLPCQNDIERLTVSFGLMAYIASFGLPVLDRPMVEGWSCAKAALTVPLSVLNLATLPLLCSGVINLLAPVFLVLWCKGAAEIARYRLALWTLGLLPLSALFFAMLGMMPGIGYFAWVAGLLMMMGPEAVWYFRGGRR
jgi:hypothetical protein